MLYYSKSALFGWKVCSRDKKDVFYLKARSDIYTALLKIIKDRKEDILHVNTTTPCQFQCLHIKHYIDTVSKYWQVLIMFELGEIMKWWHSYAVACVSYGYNNKLSTF